MSRPVKLVKQLSLESLTHQYKTETNGRMKERLLAILMLYEGKSIGDVAQVVHHHYGTIERWIKAWNTGGYEALTPQYKGKTTGYLTPEEWEQVITEIADQGLTIQGVQRYLQETRNLTYTYKGVWYALRYRRKVPYGKPRIQNSKRPADAETQLKKTSNCFYSSPSHNK